MKKTLVLISLLLSGCFSVDLSSRAEFADVVGKKLVTQCASMVTPGSVMKSVGSGGDLELLILTEDIDQRVRQSVMVPVGTELRVDKIERRNSIDHGVEVLAFGIIRHPDTGKMEPFAYKLTRNGGGAIVHAPWEGDNVPELRKAELGGIRDFKIGPPMNPVLR
jgi:hypothetical protein